MCPYQGEKSKLHHQNFNIEKLQNSKSLQWYIGYASACPSNLQWPTYICTCVGYMVKRNQSRKVEKCVKNRLKWGPFLTFYVVKWEWNSDHFWQNRIFLHFLTFFFKIPYQDMSKRYLNDNASIQYAKIPCNCNLTTWPPV